MDCSARMLEICANKRVYKELIKSIIDGDNIPKELENKEYGVITCSGMMVAGHLPRESFEVMHKLLKIGGFLMFNVRDAVWDEKITDKLGYKSKVEEMIKDGKFEEAARLPFTYYKGYKGEEGVSEYIREQPGSVFVYRRT